MSRSTGPVLTIGGITLASRSIVQGQPLDLRVLMATGVAAGLFALAEKAFGDFPVAVAWLALVTVLFVRPNSTTPAPMELFVKWWNS